uniref:Uncharacterized protein n=1 Tax=Monopterus albus TaxID=43700 RepID=A0A3Q3QJS5_MONAL
MDLLWRILAALSFDCFKDSRSPTKVSSSQTGSLESSSARGPRPATLPELYLLSPPEAPLVRPPLLRPLLRPDRQPGLRGHRRPVRLPLPHVQVHPAAGRPGTVLLWVLLWALQHPAAAAYREGARESVGV